MASFVPFSAIEVAPNRQRRDFDPEALSELVISISETPYGLQHPIVVRQSDGKTFLVAGERRLRAIQEIYAFGGRIRHAGKDVPRELVPVVDLGELDPIDAFEAELEENIRRTDLSVIEQAEATARLLELRTGQAERAGKPAPRVSDLAKEVFDIPADTPRGEYGGRTTTISNQILVAKHATDPDVRRATSLKEAVKIIKKKDDAKQHAIMAEAFGSTFTAASHSLLHRDCLEWLSTAPDGQFGVILTDPPYGIDAHEFGDSGRPISVGLNPHAYDDSYDSWRTLMQVLPAALYRVAAAASHAYLFCDIGNFQELHQRMSAAGWQVHRTPLIWSNPDGYRCPWPDAGPQRKYELILYARKGDRGVTKIAGDVLEFRKDPGGLHPAQKPVALLEELLRRSSRPGDRILDPFAGSGSTIEACNNLRLACTAIERDALYYGAALARIQALKANGALF